MGRKSIIPLKKVVVRLYDGDKEELDALFPHLGHNAIIRTIVRDFLKKTKAKMEQAAQSVNVNIDLDE